MTPQSTDGQLNEFSFIISEELDETGMFVAGWFRDSATGEFHKIAGVQSGAEKLASKVGLNNDFLIAGRKLMAQRGIGSHDDWNDQIKWRFEWLADGRPGIVQVDESGKTIKSLYAWDETTGAWGEPRAEYKDALIFTTDEVKEILKVQGLNASEEDRKGSNEAAWKLLKSFVRYQGGTTYKIFYKNIEEIELFKAPNGEKMGYWWNNTVVIDGVSYPTPLYAVVSSESEDHTIFHSYIAFKNDQGIYEVFVVDGLLYGKSSGYQIK